MKICFDPDFVFLICVSSGKMVIQNTKNSFSIFISKCLHNHNIYLLAKIKSCINKPVEHINLVLSPNFEFPVPKLKKRRMKSFPMRSLTYWGILAAEATNANIKKIVQKMASTYKELT